MSWVIDCWTTELDGETSTSSHVCCSVNLLGGRFLNAMGKATATSGQGKDGARVRQGRSKGRTRGRQEQCPSQARGKARAQRYRGERRDGARLAVGVRQWSVGCALPRIWTEKFLRPNALCCYKDARGKTANNREKKNALKSDQQGRTRATCQ